MEEWPGNKGVEEERVDSANRTLVMELCFGHSPGRCPKAGAAENLLKDTRVVGKERARGEKTERISER